jgi:hypothetical protein
MLALVRSIYIKLVIGGDVADVQVYTYRNVIYSIHHMYIQYMYMYVYTQC